MHPKVITFGAALSAALLIATFLVWQPLTAAWQWAAGLVLFGMVTILAALVAMGGEAQIGNRAFRQLATITLVVGVITALLSGLPDTTATQPYSYGFVGALGLLIFWTVRRALTGQYQPTVRRLTLFSTLSYVFMLALLVSPFWAGASVTPAVLRGSSLVLVGLLIALLVAVTRLPNKADPETVKEKKPAPKWQVVFNDVMTLMKVRVSSLLLATTLGAMVVAAQGWPGWGLVFWVMLGGLISVGGAGSLNHYLDRDIDVNMGRTSARPIPSGRVTPNQALLLGIFLTFLQFLVFWTQVNPFSAWLSTGGLVYYILIYTIWLKRSSPQNIVIGGAAGAFPPLVGWAAVTGDLSLGALYLFAIIFYWTPPHFWALALMRKADYERAGIPMMPVVMGDAETRRQIVLYTLLMIALTIMVVPLQIMGFVYLGAAVLLNAKFLWDAWRLYRAPSNQSALTLYKYSLLYLFLLFVAMAVDRALVA